MKHLARAGILVGLVFASVIGVNVLVRTVSVPESWEPYGLYRTTAIDDAEVWASRPVRFAPTTECQSCHTQIYGSWEAAGHQAVPCETCHGPGQAHISDGAVLDTTIALELCVRCHEKLAARPTDFPQVESESHRRQLQCKECHNPHSPKPVPIPDAPRIPHEAQGVGNCLLCHGEGAFKPFPADHQGREAGICLNCHEVK